MLKEYIMRIHWGYWMPYGQQPFHHVDYCWDGQNTADNGQILRCWLIEFDGISGPTREKLVLLDKPNWHWHVKRTTRRLGGILFEPEGSPETTVRFFTRTVDMRFRIGDLIERKLIRQHIGSRYNCVNVTAMLDGYDPNLDTPKDIAFLIEADGRWRKLTRFCY